MNTAADFFQPARTYWRGRWAFQCLAVAPNPFNQEIRAVGFLYRPGEPATATALAPDDWERGEWTAAPECHHCGRRVSSDKRNPVEHDPKCPLNEPPF